MVLIAVLANVRRVWLLPVLFSLASIYMWMLVKHAPPLHHMDARQVRSQLRFPYSLDELRSLSAVLQMYQTEHWHYTLLLFCSAYLFKQAFSIPGSVFLNMLSGALYGRLEGGLLCCLLATGGASLCYQLSERCCRHLLAQLFPARIRQLTSRVDQNRHQMLYYLLFIRLFPVTPNWFVNLAAPVVGVPLNLFAVSVFVGLLPYNLVCSQAGSLLGQLRSVDDLLSGSTAAWLALLAFTALLPTIYHKVRHPPPTAATSRHHRLRHHRHHLATKTQCQCCTASPDCQCHTHRVPALSAVTNSTTTTTHKHCTH